MDSDVEHSGGHNEIGQSKHFGMRAITVLNCYAFLAVVPLLILAPLALIAVHGFNSFPIFVLLMALAGLLPVYFLPLILGNPHVVRLVNLTTPSSTQDSIVVQIALDPRIYSGFRAFIEDADDIGILRLTSTHLFFAGDRITLSIPFSSIERVELRNIGLRGLFICGGRIRIRCVGLSSVKSIELTHRSAWTVPSSRRAAKSLCNEISANIRKSP